MTKKEIKELVDKELNRTSDDALKRRSTECLENGLYELLNEIDALEYKKRLIENELTYRKYPETRP